MLTLYIDFSALFFFFPANVSAYFRIFHSARAQSSHINGHFSDCNLDITVYERQSDGNNSELGRPLARSWGGNRVNDEFNTMLTNITGTSLFERFRKDDEGDFLDMQRELETKKEGDWR